jgi:alcohol dehydrogenase class IV
MKVNWNYPTSVRFGPGRIAELGAAAAELEMRRPLVVTDRGLAQSEILGRALGALGGSARVFADVRGNPTERNVLDGLAAFRAGGHDGVVAFGGGSALDAGKAIALMAGQRRPLFDFVDEGDNWKRVDPGGMAPAVAVPTTAGTGSEVGRSAVVTDEASRTKRVVFHPRMMPAIVIADPALTTGLPPAVTAAVGMDALSHALEAYCCAMFHPMADGIALEAMRLVKAWLPRAVAEGSDLEARSHMLAAASMGAVAFQKGLGAMHAMSHPCSAFYDTHHGLTNAVLMPYVLAFNRPAVEDKLVHLARVLALPSASFAAVLDWILELRRGIGVPHALSALGVPEDAAESLARAAEADPLTALNPRPVSAAEYAALYRQALRGELG